MSFLRARPVGLALGVAAAMGVAAGSAGANQSLIHDTSLNVDGNAYQWQQSTFDSNRVVSHRGYEYSAYWDSDRTMQIVRRRLSDDDVQTINLTSIRVSRQDGHRSIGLGISPGDGRLHIVYDHHNNELRYMHTANGCLTSPPSTFANSGVCAFTVDDWDPGTNHDEGTVTYPKFVTSPAGQLMASYRDGTSSNGDEELYKYNSSTHTWSWVGTVWDRRGTYREVWGDLSTRRGVYIAPLRFDRNERLHATWTYREPGNFDHNHDVHYAYSDDYGVHWKDNSGTQIADMSARTPDPLELSDSSAVVVAVPQRSWLINQWRMTLDSNGQPHIAPFRTTGTADEFTATNLHQWHVWRTMDGTWHHQYVDDINVPNQIPYAGNIVFDDADNAYWFYAQSEMGWISDAPDEGLVSWQPDGSGGGYIDIQLVAPEDGPSEIFTRPSPIGTTIGTGSSSNKIVKIRMKNSSAATRARIWFTSTALPDWHSSRTKEFTINANDRSYTEYTIDMSDLPGWTGTLRDLAIDPGLSVTSGNASIDWIRVQTSGGTVAKRWDFSRGISLKIAEASPGDNWATWDIYDALPTDTSLGMSDSAWGHDEQRFKDERVISLHALLQGSPGNEWFTLQDYTIDDTSVRKYWAFPADAMGWTPWSGNRHVTGFTASGGTISGTIAGNDGRIYSADQLQQPLERGDRYVHIRMKQTGNATHGAFLFITNSDTTWDLTKMQTFRVTADGAYHTYVLDMNSVPGWNSSTLRRVRLNPHDVASSGTFSGTFTIDRIWISSRS